jgi:tetratricopeptide (TPR) repeat protein
MARERRALRDRLRLSGSAGRRGRAVQHRETPDSRTVQGEAGEWDDIDDALANLSRDIKLRPADAWAISSRGQIYLGLGRYDEALADLDRALELDPDGETFGSRGQVYRLLGREEEARADFARAIELDPGYKPTGD